MDHVEKETSAALKRDKDGFLDQICRLKAVMLHQQTELQSFKKEERDTAERNKRLSEKLKEETMETVKKR